MTIRLRIAITLAVSIAAAALTALLINAFVFRAATYPTWHGYSAALMEEMGTSREGVVEQLRKDPELLFGAPGDLRSPVTGKTIDEAAQVVQQRAVDDAVHRARVWTAAAMGLVLVVSVTGGWFISGRILRPIRLITRRAKAASALDLDSRVALDGPHDELRELGDTFDVMLDRIALSLTAHRRFAAQVAHELRTPLATASAEIEMLLADADDPHTKERLASVADATSRSDNLVRQLLVLARTDLGDLDVSTFPLDDLVGNVVGRAVEREPFPSLRVDLELEEAPVWGDRPLLESLVRNLVDNAGRHNHAGGWVRVAVGPSTDHGRAVLEVSNSVVGSGDDRDPQDVPGRPHTGLSIVEAVVAAHDGLLEWESGSGEVVARVTLPARSPDALTPALA